MVSRVVGYKYFMDKNVQSEFVWFDGKLNSVKIEITVQGISHKLSSFTKTL